MCTRSSGPVGSDGSQAADQVVTEGAKLRQRQVGRHLDVVVTMETGGQVQTVVLFHHISPELSHLLHLKHRKTQSAVSVGAANHSTAPLRQDEHRRRRRRDTSSSSFRTHFNLLNRQDLVCDRRSAGLKSPQGGAGEKSSNHNQSDVIQCDITSCGVHYLW